MKKFTSEMIDFYADELLIGLTREENEMVENEFEKIDRTCDLVNKIPNITDVEPMTHCLDDFIIELREDTYSDSADIEELLRNADEVNDREVEIVKVVGE